MSTPAAQKPSEKVIINFPSREMIDRWAETQADRSVVDDFWDFLSEKCDEKTLFMDLNLEKLLDEYHNIDRRKLDNERRALLAQAGKLNGHP